MEIEFYESTRVADKYNYYHLIIYVKIVRASVRYN